MADFDYSRAMQLRQIHGVLAAIAFVGLFPMGSILLRVVPGRLAWIVHAAIQMLGYVVYIAAAALGLYLVSMIRIAQNGESMVRSPS
jgi:hypothetical protein